MARNPLTPAEMIGPQFVGATPPDMAAQEIAAREKMDMVDEVLAAGIDLGRIEALDFILTVSNSAILAVYEKVKKTKAWRFMRNPQNSHGEHFQSIEEFCEVKLGKSYKRLQAITANRNTLGQEAFEQAERLGLRQTDHDLIKSLPAPKQEIIKEALSDDTDKEALQRLIRDLAAADQKEIESLEKRAKAAEENLNAAQRLNADKDKELNVVKTKLFAEQASAAQRTPIDIGKELRGAMQDQAASAEREMRRLRPAMMALMGHTEAHGINHEEIMLGMICQLERVIWEWKEEFAFNKARPTGDGVGDYFREAGLLTPEDIAADQAAFLAAKDTKRDPRVVDFINGKADQE